MKKDWSRIEQFRVQSPGHVSVTGDRHGLFIIPANLRYKLYCIAASGEDYFSQWEYVSVRGEERWCAGDYKMKTPSWSDMQKVKEIFWDDEETVVQYHPSRANNINSESHTLFLWRNTRIGFPCPPELMV